MGIAELIVLSAALACLSCTAHAQESPREKMPFSISCGRRTGRRSRADFGVVSVCATWALLMRVTIFRTAVIIIC